MPQPSRLQLAIVSIVFTVGCAKAQTSPKPTVSDSQDGSASPQPLPFYTPQTLDAYVGAWQATCVPSTAAANQYNSTTKTILADGTATTEITYYADQACKTALIRSKASDKLELTGPAPGIADAVKVTATVLQLTSTVLDQATLASYQQNQTPSPSPSAANAVSGCDPSTWRLGAAADVTACNAKVSYNIWQVSTGRLITGLNDSNHSGLTEAGRPVSLDPGSALTKATTP